MLILPLDPTDEDADPAFKNISSCKKWLKQLQLANLSAAHATLRTQIDEFNRYPLRGLERMETLELLRETVHQLQTEYAKKLVGKPLPLSEIELVMLTSMTGLWQAMAAGYQRCLLAYEEGERQLKNHGALLCHRCLMYSGRQIFDFLRTGYERNGEQWRQFHAVYLFAEEQNLLSEEVEDDLGEHDHDTTCRYIYLNTLLICHARPQELTRHQQELLEQWISLWFDTFTIELTCTVSRGDAPPLAIDLADAQGLQPLRPEFLESGNMRYLPMVPISKLLRVKTILLQQGHTPKQLDLGDENDNVDCIALLSHLHKNWCEPRAQRMAERQDSTQEVQLRYGLEDIYSWVANQPFDHLKKSANIPQESWRTEDVSILGARLLRTATTGARLGLNHILVVRAADTYRVGKIVWISVLPTGQLHMGIRFQPGIPQAVTVKATVKPGEPPSKSVPAILLSAVPSLSIPPSLLLPRNLFQPDRIVEVAMTNNEKQRIKLKFSVERGLDFERVSFLPE